jgi:hypothetical protein
MDLFTVWSDNNRLQPWFFSDSVCGLLGLKRAVFGEIEKREKHVIEVLKEKDIKDKTQVWDKQLKPLYGKEFKSISKEIQTIIDSSFEPTIFSVLSYGTVGAIRQKIFAIIEKRPSSQGQGASFTVKKIYWI